MATYYASHNAAGGGAGTIGDPYTLAELATNVTAGNVGLIMATGTYTPSATTTLGNSGTVTSRVQIRGCASDGTDDGTVATISGSSLGGGVHGITLSGSYIDLANLLVTTCPGTAVHSSGANSRLRNVRMTASANGFTQNDFNEATEFIECEFDNNTGYGYGGSVASRGAGVFRRCSVHNNGSYGVRVSQVGRISDCLIFRNGSHGVILDLSNSGSQQIAVVRSTIFNNTGNGIDLNAGTSASTLLIQQCIIASNTAYGFDYNTTSANIVQIVRCGFYNNTSGALDTGSLPSDCVTTDPGFASTTAGSEDFTPSNTDYRSSVSPYQSGIGGTDYRWIGAVSPQGSGSSTVALLNRRTNSLSLR